MQLPGQDAVCLRCAHVRHAFQLRLVWFSIGGKQNGIHTFSQISWRVSLADFATALLLASRATFSQDKLTRQATSIRRSTPARLYRMPEMLVFKQTCNFKIVSRTQGHHCERSALVALVKRFDVHKPVPHWLTLPSLVQFAWLCWPSHFVCSHSAIFRSACSAPCGECSESFWKLQNQSQSFDESRTLGSTGLGTCNIANINLTSQNKSCLLLTWWS